MGNSLAKGRLRDVGVRHAYALILGVLRHGDRTHGRVARKPRRLAILIRTTSQVGRAVLRHIASLSSRPFRSRRSFRTNSSCPFHRVSLRALATLLRLITQGYRPVIEHADTSRRVPACYRSGGVQRYARCRCRAAIAAGLQGQRAPLASRPRRRCARPRRCRIAPHVWSA